MTPVYSGLSNKQNSSGITYFTLDVVCGMEMNYDLAPFSSDYKGRTFKFCSFVCYQKFNKNPAVASLTNWRAY